MTNEQPDSNAQPFILEPVAMPQAFPKVLGGPDDAEGASKIAAQGDDEAVPTQVDRKLLQLDHFTALLGGEMTVVGANAKVAFALVEGVEKPKSRYPGQKRMPFSLVFRSPAGVLLGGDHFDLLHPALGTIPFILMTRTMAYPDQEPGAYYEVMFN